MSIFSDWPHNWYGFWKKREERYPLPLLADLFDSDWMPSDKDRLIRYLEQSPIAVTSMGPESTCQLCGDSVGNSSCYKSDGVWLWPLSLAHFVSKHAVRLPDRMVKHIVTKNYVPIANLSVSPDKLPWPRLVK
jgi:hypothetical protein